MAACDCTPWTELNWCASGNEATSRCGCTIEGIDFCALIDDSEIAVVGHSQGGLTAYWMTGDPNYGVHEEHPGHVGYDERVTAIVVSDMLVDGPYWDGVLARVNVPHLLITTDAEAGAAQAAKVGSEVSEVKRLTRNRGTFTLGP